MPASGRRWWQHPALIIALLVLIPPAGIALAWTSPWGRGKKIVATVLAGLWFLTPFLGDPPGKAKADAGPAALASASPGASPRPSGPPGLVGRNLKEAKAAASAAGFDAVSHDASEGDAAQLAEADWKVCFQALVTRQAGAVPALDFGVVRSDAPCPARDGEPVPYPRMPEVVGLTFAKASETLGPIGFQKTEPYSAYTDVVLPAAVADWVVCFQEPEKGKEVREPKGASARLGLTAPGTGCPGTPNTELHPKPAPAPTPTSTPTHTDDDSGSSSSGGSSSGGSGTGGAGSGTVTPGAFCSTPGATGIGKNGGVYTCKGPGQDRWRR
ncbi:PASTA domain-containing protein [Streptomyces sp. NPDC006326]|uniref:PASTA domain-containing protein n=1 Tax=Streptomyces sp. NPDC006326 TaxID=3156752 RepID=UPI0033BC3611